MKIFPELDHSNQPFIQSLTADKVIDNHRRQVLDAHYSFVEPTKTNNPCMLSYMPEMAGLLGIASQDMDSKEMLAVLSGNAVIPGTKPYAMCYGGHQFGNWAGQLGDGRAINLFDIQHEGKSWTLQLKGAGETPYSRSADGLAVLRSSIREYLCSEAMHHLGVPSTRALSLCLTGEQVLRDMLYDGNAAMEKGAVVCRVAPSFLRFGNYEIFAARKDYGNLRNLVDFTIRHFFDKTETTAFTKEDYVAFFQEVVSRTRKMIVEWQRVGFVHGVMNTDNMSILGLTIDYGPYGWLDNYDPNWTPNTTDRQYKRYRYGHQASIGLWNLVRLANAIYPLINESEPLEEILTAFQVDFQREYVEMMMAKLGLSNKSENDLDYIRELEQLLQVVETDMTIFFRLLANVGDLDNNSQALDRVSAAFYHEDNLVGQTKEKWLHWFSAYLKRISSESDTNEQRKQKMNKSNPKYVLRNYMAQLAIDLADAGDLSLIKEFQVLLQKPYDEQPDLERWFSKRPDWARTRVGCSMLSCSS